jgi:hypothetical protein
MATFKFLIIDEYYNVEGANDEARALKYCSDGCTVIDVAEMASAEGEERLSDFDEIEEVAEHPDELDPPMEDEDEGEGTDA